MGSLASGRVSKLGYEKSNFIADFGFTCIKYLKARMNNPKTPQDIKDKIALQVGSKIMQPQSSGKDSRLIIINQPKINQEKQPDIISIQ